MRVSVGVRLDVPVGVSVNEGVRVAESERVVVSDGIGESVAVGVGEFVTVMTEGDKLGDKVNVGVKVGTGAQICRIARTEHTTIAAKSMITTNTIPGPSLNCLVVGISSPWDNYRGAKIRVTPPATVSPALTIIRVSANSQ